MSSSSGADEKKDMFQKKDDLITSSIRYMQYAIEKVPKGIGSIEGISTGILNGLQKVEYGVISRNNQSEKDKEEDAIIRDKLVSLFQDPQIYSQRSGNKIVPTSPISAYMLKYLAKQINSGEFKTEDDCNNWIANAYLTLVDYTVKLYKHLYTQGEDVNPPNNPWLQPLLPLIQNAFLAIETPDEKIKKKDIGFEDTSSLGEWGEEWLPPWSSQAAPYRSFLNTLSETKIPSFNTPILRELKLSEKLEKNFNDYKMQLIKDWNAFNRAPHSVDEVKAEAQKMNQHLELLQAIANILSKYDTASLSKQGQIKILAGAFIASTTIPGKDPRRVEISSRNDILLQVLNKVSSMTTEYSNTMFRGKQNFATLLKEALETKPVKELNMVSAPTPKFKGFDSGSST